MHNKTIINTSSELLEKMSINGYNSLNLVDKQLVDLFDANPNNTYFISFPRTGSHWLRLIMELYFERPSLTRAFYFPERMDFLTLHTHDMELEVNREDVIYLYRDPVETVYSQLNYYKESIAEENRIRYWAEYYARHLDKWLCREHFTKHKTILTYEGLKNNLCGEFSKIANHFGVPLDTNRLTEIASKVSKDEVKRKTAHDEQVVTISSDYEQQRFEFKKTYGALIYSVLFEWQPELKSAFLTRESCNIVADTSLAITKNPKIVGLVPARNEYNIIGQCLRALSRFTDAIVYLDDASTDDTLFIVESLAQECRIDRIIRKNTWYRDEPGDRNALLAAGREIGGTHFIVLDTDEMFTANWLKDNYLRNLILKLHPGDSLAFTWIQLWRDTETYRYDSSQWANENKAFVFCDDDNCFYTSEFIHTQRVPVNLSGVIHRIEGYNFGVLHFQFVNWKNLLIKQAWYRCLEHIRTPEKTIDDINKLYAPSKDESNLGLAPSPRNWFDGYTFFDSSVFFVPEEWRRIQVSEWFTTYGKDYFKDLDIWDVEWEASSALYSKQKNIPQRLSSINECVGMPTKEIALKLIEDKPWHHNFEIVPGVRTNGSYDPSGLFQELQLPLNLNGASVADVGASNGYFSFEARKRGARVVAFDFRHKQNSGFGLAQYINGLNDIGHHQINVLDMKPDQYGKFDIVLALGLLYHTADPYRALANCAALASNRLLIESYCIDALLPASMSFEPIMRFIPDPQRFPDQGQPNSDRSNFWGFNAKCLQNMVEDLGFTVQRRTVSGDRVLMDARRIIFNTSETRLGIAYDLITPVALAGDPDDPESWIIF